MTHTELIFVYKEGDQLHSLVCGWPVLPTLFVEKISPLNCLGTLAKNQLTTNVRVYLWTLNSFPLIYIFILMPVPHCLAFCCFVVGFEIGRMTSSSNFVLILQDCSGYSVSLDFHMRFLPKKRKKKKPAGILIGFWLALNL